MPCRVRSCHLSIKRPFALAAEGKLDQAVVHCAEALRLNPDLAETYHNLGVALAKQRKIDEATFFWLTTMWAYLWYVEWPGMGRCLLLPLSFALGPMAKPMVVTEPLSCS